MSEFESRAEKWFWYTLVGCAGAVVVGLVAFDLFGKLALLWDLVRALGSVKAIAIAGGVLLLFALLFRYLGRSD